MASADMHRIGVVVQYVGLASYTVLIYDHLLTLDDEIKYIWKKKKGSPRA